MASAASKIRVCRSRNEHDGPTVGREKRCQMVDNFERNLNSVKVKRKPIDRRVDQSLPGTLAGRTNRCLDAAFAAMKRDNPLYPCGGAGGGRKDGNDALGEDPGFVGVPRSERAALQVTIEPKTKPRPLPPRVENWMANFLRKSTRERVQWRSKLHGAGREHCEETLLPERVEQLTDAGAHDFVQWLNGLGAERSSLTQDIVKQLFSSGTGDETSRALSIAPKEVRAVPASIAEEWNLQQLALENRIAEVHDRDRKWLGALPRQQPNDGVIGGEGVEPPDVPEDLMSLKRLFRDIWHLRSVKYLVDYLVERPALPRPRFLVEKGLFQRQNAVEPAPFYRKVLSQKAIAESLRK